MDNVSYTIWLVKQASSGLLYLWPVTLLLLVFSMVAVARSRKNGYCIPAKHVALMAAPVIGILLTTISGVFYRNQVDYVAFPYLGFILTVILAFLVIYKTKQWLVVGAVECLIIYIAFFFWFISVMSVSGDWI